MHYLSSHVQHIVQPDVFPIDEMTGSIQDVRQE